MAIAELAPSAFPLASSLVHQPENMPEVVSVLEGTNPGWVTVDDVVSPTAALIWAKGIEGFYLVGDPMSAPFHEQLSSYFAEVIHPRMAAEDLDSVEVSCDRSSWNDWIPKILGLVDVSQSYQYVYGPSSEHHSPNDAMESAPVMAITKDALLAWESTFVDDKIHAFWSDTDSFLRSGFGYVALSDGRPVSLCVCAFAAGDTRVIDIETTEQYRRRGYAYAAAAAFVTHCTESALVPYWDCMEENVPSRSLAERIGLVLLRRYVLHSGPLPKRGV